MRQNAQSKRGRGRSGGRGGGGGSGGGGGGGSRPYSNPTNRTYDSSGPDVKIRGTAMHIYDKYQQLARDASSSGDRIGAENYLQHAEHYYRLMIANNALQQQQQQQNPQHQQHNGQRPNGQGQEGAHVHGSEQQPRGPVTFGMDGEEMDGQPVAPRVVAPAAAPNEDEEQPEPRQPRN